MIRLKKGRTVRGRVVDHLGKPVKDVSVFAVRPSGMTLAGGRAVNSFDGEEDRTVRGVKTDSEGRFELALSVAEGKPRPDGDPTASARVTPGLVVSSAATRFLAGAVAGRGGRSGYSPSASHTSGNSLRHRRV